MNETQWKHRLQYARDHYPPGTRVRLLAMPDDPQPIPPGTTGTVMGVDDAEEVPAAVRLVVPAVAWISADFSDSDRRKRAKP